MDVLMRVEMRRSDAVVPSGDYLRLEFGPDLLEDMLSLRTSGRAESDQLCGGPSERPIAIGEVRYPMGRSDCPAVREAEMEADGQSVDLPDSGSSVTKIGCGNKNSGRGQETFTISLDDPAIDLRMNT